MPHVRPAGGLCDQKRRRVVLVDCGRGPLPASARVTRRLASEMQDTAAHGDGGSLPAGAPVPPLAALGTQDGAAHSDGGSLPAKARLASPPASGPSEDWQQQGPLRSVDAAKEECGRYLQSACFGHWLPPASLSPVHEAQLTCTDVRERFLNACVSTLPSDTQTEPAIDAVLPPSSLIPVEGQLRVRFAMAADRVRPRAGGMVVGTPRRPAGEVRSTAWRCRTAQGSERLPGHAAVPYPH